jgi:ABC-2 type transport system ATP-binding protein
LNSSVLPAIEAHGIGVVYKLPRHDASSLRELSSRIFRSRGRPDTLVALCEVTFSVCPGEVLAIIGPNGAGKSTIMKVLARVLPLSSGRVVVRGDVSPMIELGAGFNFEQTARENIILYGSLLGRSPARMKQSVEGILDWAQLGDFVDVPLRAFSSGMVARLAFSIASEVKPAILLIDEILAVGDAAFRERSAQRVDQLIDAGAAVVLVSHNMEDVTKRANRALFLRHGRVVAEGDPGVVVATYEASLE